MPSLFVIAGPNGAGKSTFSKDLVPAALDVFDGDKELIRLQQKFPDTEPAQLLSYVNETLFPGQKALAVSEKKDFAFETNFASITVMDTVTLFKESAYDVHLIFIGLISIGHAMERVDLRVRRGGHSVSGDDIRTNYDEGLKNLKKFINDFDRVLIYDNSGKSRLSLPRLQCKLQNGKLIEKSTEISAWASRILEENNRLLKKKRISPHKGRRL